MGSMLAARFAGRRHATVAHTRGSSVTPASIHGAEILQASNDAEPSPESKCNKSPVAMPLATMAPRER
jgi:hypothetical protein